MPRLNRSRPVSHEPIEVKLRKVIPLVPLEDPERGNLMQDLTVMGCEGLLDKPWGFKEERIVRELVGKVSNQFDYTLHGLPHLWTEERWREVYDFRQEGQGLASRKDKFIRGKFRGVVNPKDGYAIEDCVNDRHWALLQFLIPIIHSEKPNRVTITLGNTIFGSLLGNRKVDWG